MLVKFGSSDDAQVYLNFTAFIYSGTMGKYTIR